MGNGSFVKLFSTITESTVWCEPDRTRLVWICMLAMADAQGKVWGSIPGLANRARVPVDDCREAIACFLRPDRYSRSKEHEGRRIEEIDGGWQLLNYIRYRELRNSESVRERKRKWIANKRAENKKTLTIRAANVTVNANNVDRDVDK